MATTILVYSIFSALTYFARTTWQVQALRLLVAFGTGGEWAVAAALVAETFPTRARAAASGLFHASSVIGVGLAAMAGEFVAPESWRSAFLVGLLPALLVVWIRFGLREPAGPGARRRTSRPTWAASANSSAGGRGVRAPCWGSAWPPSGWGRTGGSSPGAPNWRPGRSAPGRRPSRRSKASSRAYLLMNFTGGLAGLLSFAPLANRLGRRGAFAVYHVGAGLLAPWAYLGQYTYLPTLGLLSLMAFFVLGMHAGYAIYFPELFPTRLRATGSSVCFNVGRVLGAVILVIRGELGQHLGMPRAAAAISGLFWIGLILLWFAPETCGRELPT